MATSVGYDQMESSPTERKSGDDAERLSVSLKAVFDLRPVLHALVEFVFSNMAERRMSEVVSEARRFHDIGAERCMGVVAEEALSQSPPKLGNLQRMGQSIVKETPLGCRDDLGDLSEPSEGIRVENAVTVPLVGSSCRLVGIGRIESILARRSHGTTSFQSRSSLKAPASTSRRTADRASSALGAFPVFTGVRLMTLLTRSATGSGVARAASMIFASSFLLALTNWNVAKPGIGLNSLRLPFGPARHFPFR